MNLIMCLLVSVVSGKVTTGTITLGGGGIVPDNNWKYISKFAYQIGTGKWSVRFKTIRPNVTRPITLSADVYLDTNWDDIESLPACERVSHRRTTGSVDLPVDGEWSKWVTGNLAQSIRPHVWYFVVQDCANNLAVSTRIKYEFTAIQEDGSHFSSEMSGTPSVLLLQLIFYSVFSYYFVQACRRFYVSFDGLHPVIWTLTSAVLLHLFAILLECIHLWSYSSDGQGFKALNVIGQMSESLSQVVLSSLLILIALGYTLLHSSLGNLDIVIPIVFIIGIVHLLLVGFGKIKDDASYKFSENEGVVGWLLASLRCALLAWFLWGSYETRKVSNMKIQTFLRRFEVAGALYFLSFPATLIISVYMIPNYGRHRFMVAGLFVISFASYVWLSRLFLGRGQYFSVSTLSSSFLPGGLKPGADRDE